MKPKRRMRLFRINDCNSYSNTTYYGGAECEMPGNKFISIVAPNLIKQVCCIHHKADIRRKNFSLLSVVKTR